MSLLVVWLKSIHVAALALWGGGLLVLPVLLWRRKLKEVSGPALFRLQAMTRFLYVVLVSPAAFVAIASGTALILLRETFTNWFAVKLALVGVLVALHVWVGLLVGSVFQPRGRFAGWRAISSLVVLSAVQVAIFAVVLAKPAISDSVLPAILSEPGGLGRLAGELLPDGVLPAAITPPPSPTP